MASGGVASGGPAAAPNTLTPPLSPCQVTADEVCGCPLVRDVFEPTGEFCRVSKRKCNKHYCWEKLRRAEVDLERVRVVTHADFTPARQKGAECNRPSTRLPVSGTSWTSSSSRSAT